MAVQECLETSREHKVWVETDMRAHVNPTRMKMIGRLAETLARRLIACAHLVIRQAGDVLISMADYFAAGAARPLMKSKLRFMVVLNVAIKKRSLHRTAKMLRSQVAVRFAILRYLLIKFMTSLLSMRELHRLAHAILH